MSSKELKIPLPEVGQWETIIGVPQRADGKDISGGDPSPLGSSGAYTVRFILGPTTYEVAPGKIDNGFEGDSFIQFRNPDDTDPTQIAEAHLDCYGPQGERAKARIICNSKGRMSSIIFDAIQAENRKEAENTAYLLVSPHVSWMSFAYDVPVQIVRTVTTELKTATVSTTLWMNPKVKALDGRFQLPDVPHSPIMLECVGQYREGLSSTNDFYSFLCFWKAFEGITKIRTKLNKFIAEKNVSGLPRRMLEIPDVPEVRSSYPKFVGRSLGYAQEQFRKTHRDAVAHLDTATGTFASAHSLEAMDEVRKAIPVMRLVAKLEINNQMSVYKAIFELGHGNVLA